MWIRVPVPLLLLAAVSVGPAPAQDRRHVTEPRIPAICASLEATASWPLDESKPDTLRIQAAIDRCPAGQAVELKTSGEADAFLSGPLHLRSGVTLFVGQEAFLYASRNPRDYDVRPGSCGIISDKGGGCRALINGEGVSGAGVMGDGVIDGRGGEKMLGSGLTWWELADKARAGGIQNNPRLIILRSSPDFTLYRITLRNSPNFHVSAYESDRFTAWGVKIHSPKRARNTDGIDPSNSSDVTITGSWIDTGDDNVAIKSGAGRPATHITIAHNHFYSGHGMSIGSETNGGVSAVRVTDLSIDGADNGIRIKSNNARGGLVEDVIYDDVCIKDTKNPLFFDTHYNSGEAPGKLLPSFRSVTLHAVRVEDGGRITLDGYDAAHPLGLSFEKFALFNPAAITVVAKNAPEFRPAAFAADAATDSCASKFVPFPRSSSLLRVAPDGSGDYPTVQDAVSAVTPGERIVIAPGVYREKVILRTAAVTLRGAGGTPADTVIVLDQSAGSTGSTFRSATVEIRAPDFRASNITFANDFNRTHEQTAQGAQALALLVNADRAVFRNIRLLGNQDTLYAASANCNPDGNPCTVTRQYFADCYIEGNVDFIFGDGKAFFDRCEIHSTAHNGGYITAQGKHYADENSGFVFRDCKLTADPAAREVWLGRPWRPYASVVFLNTEMGPHIVPGGWREWRPGDTDYLNTVDYAEYGSRGPGSARETRDPHTRFLTESEARALTPAAFLRGSDQWNPERK
jgi:polygalacturonase